MNNKLNKLNKKIIKCRKCPRLINFVKKISTEKRKQNINETYWENPFLDLEIQIATSNIRASTCRSWRH